MRLGVFSDLHGSRKRWEAFLRVVPGLELSEYVCCGDLLGGAQEISAMLADMAALPRVHWVAGNNDMYILRNLIRESPPGNAAPRFHPAPALPRALREKLACLPACLETVAEGVRIAVMHGSPLDPLNGRLYPADIPRFVYRGDAQVVITGHTHCRMAVSHNGILFLNPGSLAQPRDHSPPGFAVLSLPQKTVEFIDLG